MNPTLQITPEGSPEFHPTLVACVYKYSVDAGVTDERCQVEGTVEGIITLDDIKFYVQKVVLDGLSNLTQYKVSYKGTAALINQPEFNNDLDDGTGTEFKFIMNFLNKEVSSFTKESPFFNIEIETGHEDLSVLSLLNRLRTTDTHVDVKPPRGLSSV